MPSPRLHCPEDGVVERGLAKLRERLEVPDGFPEPVRAAADAEVAGVDLWSNRIDRRDLDLVTIDPPGSRDLDQAFHAEARGDGHRVHYAIADVGAFVAPGGPVAQEAWERGVTLYSPEHRAPLHPDAIGEGAASLLPEVDRPAVLWTIDLADDGEIVDVDVRRAMVRSRAQMTYEDVQTRIDRGDAGPSLSLLPVIGEVRRSLLRDAGGISLALADQDVVRDGDGYRLVYDAPLPVERWNEQISLLTGMAAASLMLEAGVGILRTLPRPDATTVRQLGHSARALGVPWSDDAAEYAAVLQDLDPAVPTHAALIAASARLFRGAAYEPFRGDPPDDPVHHAIGGAYAHVTAPLRRLIDRFTNEIALSVCADVPVPAWVEAGFPDLPAAMDRARQRQSRLDRASVDLMEALVLEARVGASFAAVVTAVDDDDRATVQLTDPAVITTVEGLSCEPGDRVELRLEAVDLDEAAVTFVAAEG